MKVHQLLQVSEDDTTLSPQVLWHVSALHLREIVVNDVPQRTHIFPLCCYHLIYDVP